MSKDITVSFVGNIVSEHGKSEIIVSIRTMLLETLYKRTYFWPIVNGTQYTDEHASSDARMYFQCALVCSLKCEWDEALNWYTMGSRWFTDTAVLSSDKNDVQCDWNHYTEYYDVSVNAWINTMYGSKQELIKVADIQTFCLHNRDMTGHDVIDRMEVLRDEWFTVVADERTKIIANEAAIAEFRASIDNYID